MTVDETECHVVKAELDHHTTFVSVSYWIYCSVIPVMRRYVYCIATLDKDGKKHLAFAYIVNLDEFWSKKFSDQLYLSLFL